MAKFKFRWESILRFRQRIEDHKKLAVAKANHARLSSLKTLEETSSRLESATKSGSELAAAAPKLDDLKQIYQYRLALTQQQAEQNFDLEAKQVDLDAAVSVLVKARKDRRVIEILKEKQFDKWKIEEERKEQAELDEISVNIFVRNQAGLGIKV
ncbi:MAG: flagellar export protein FliJ [Candidatus Lindowbacteria bacterium]|nr:flagellar export protein FliJ [Candidatus Lindowbacteria bacterium]